MMRIILILLQLGFFIALAPLLSGLIAKIKNNLRMRKGQSVLQPYYNLIKLYFKNEVISETASGIFRVTPFIVISSVLTVALLIPVFVFASPLDQAGDFLRLYLFLP